MNITYDKENPDQGKVKIEIVQNMCASMNNFRYLIII